MRYKDRAFLEELDREIAIKKEFLSQKTLDELIQLRNELNEKASILIYQKPKVEDGEPLSNEEVFARYFNLLEEIEDLKFKIFNLIPEKISYDKNEATGGNLAKHITDKDSDFVCNYQSFLEDVNKEIAFYKSDVYKLQKKKHSDDLINSLKIKIAKLQEICNMKINNYKDLEYAIWLYNGGKLRREYEVTDRKKELKDKAFSEYKSDVIGSEEYNKGYHPFGWFAFILLFSPAIFGILISFGASGNGYLNAVTPEGIDGLIIMGNIIRLYIDLSFFLYIPVWAGAILFVFIYVSNHNANFYVSNDEVIIEACLAAAVGIGTAAAGRAINKHMSSKKPDI